MVADRYRAGLESRVHQRDFATGLALVAVISIVSSACSKSPTTPSTSAPAATIQITAAGVNAKSVQIPLGGRVLFINNDTRDHDVLSDPHPEHTDCSAINQVGRLRPGERRETGNMVEARTCGYHDDLNFMEAGLQGSIVAK